MTLPEWLGMAHSLPECEIPPRDTAAAFTLMAVLFALWPFTVYVVLTTNWSD